MKDNNDYIQKCFYNITGFILVVLKGLLAKTKMGHGQTVIKKGFFNMEFVFKYGIWELLIHYLTP